MPSQLPKSGFPTAGLLALAVFVMGGCASEEPVTLERYLDELELANSLGEVEEVDLGAYEIASSIDLDQDANTPAESLWINVRFKLYALVAPEDKKHVLAEYERHRGMLEDAVVTICRKATREELGDSRWATFKSRLIDGVRPILGAERIRQLAFVDFSWGPID